MSCSTEKQMDDGDGDEEIERIVGSSSCNPDGYEWTSQEGCDGQIYPDPKTSPYILPIAPGTEFVMGLSNCSRSFHSAGEPDEYAYDFDLEAGSNFYAARGGIVAKIVDDQPSSGGGVGNYLVIDHGDRTFGLYYHSPQNGFFVDRRDSVKQGDLLGVIGESGLAGYPHLHFIVTSWGYEYPYDAVPVSFSNVSPPDVVLQSFLRYYACR